MTRSPLPVSVTVIARDEAAHIGRCLESVQACAEVVVVDSGSTDDTVAIAASFPNCRVVHHDWEGYAAQKAYALSLCTHDWALNLDADETASPALLEDIRTLVEADDADALDIPLKDYFLGRPPHPWAFCHTKRRFFRRSLGHYAPAAVHESITLAPEARIRRARGYIAHFGESSITVKLAKIAQYADLRARERHAQGRRPSLLKLLTVFPLMFLKSYLWRRNVLNGRRGFISSLMNAFYAFLKEARLWECAVRTPSFSAERSPPTPASSL